MLDFIGDCRIVGRLIRTQKTFGMTVTVIVAIGSGLLTVMTVLAEPFIARPLPYDDPVSLVAISVHAKGITDISQVPLIEDWSSRIDLFTGIAWIGNGTYYKVRQQGGSAMLYVVPVSANILTVLGREPASVPATGTEGLLLTTRGAERLGGSPQLRSVLRLQDGNALQIAGFLARDFLLPRQGLGTAADAVKLGATGSVAPVVVRNGRPTEGRGFLVGRLREGVTAAHIEASLSQRAESGPAIDVRVTSLSDHMQGEARADALVAVAAGGFVLLIACANVSNLLAVRLRRRGRELAIRRALGASAARIARLVGLEFAVLTGAGLLVGLLGAHVVLITNAGDIPAPYVSLGAPALTITTIGFVSIATILVLFVTGLPAVLASLRIAALVSGPAPANPQGRYARFGFITVQVGLAMILATAAVVLATSYYRLVSQETGVDTDATAVITSYPASLRGAVLADVLDDSVARLKAIPGIADAAYTQGTVVDGTIGFRAASAIWIGNEMVEADVKPVTAALFDLAGLRLTAGRALRVGDENYRAIVVNEALVAQRFKARPAIGEIVTVANRPAEVVGVVASVHDRALDIAPRPAVYHLMSPTSGALVTYVVEGAGSGEVPTGEIQKVLSSVTPDVIVVQVATLGELLRHSVIDRTFATVVSLSFAGVGLLVSLAGVAGLVSVIVADRRDELAIRLALGAPLGRIRHMVASGALLAGGVGIAAGALVARLGVGLLETLVYGVSLDSSAFVVVAAAIVWISSAIAALLPTRRISLESTTNLLRSH
jgi:predicted permease